MSTATVIWTLWAGWAFLIVLAASLRTRSYAAMTAVYIGLVAATWSGLLPAIDARWQWGVLALFGTSALHSISLVRAQLRPPWFRAAVSIPGLWFAAGSILALPWSVVAAFDITPYGWWLAFVVASVGLVQSLRNPREEIEIEVGSDDVGPLRRIRRSGPGAGDPLTIFQITDPHLGPFMSTGRLRRICEHAVACDPDLVLVTGDLLTMESQRSPDAVAEALAPLEALRGRVFACYGNHDHEARATVREGLARVGCTLLVDEITTVETGAGAIELVGADFSWRGRRNHMRALFDSLPPRNGVPRLLMLHDPGAFRFVPDGAADLTFSGHTHGGHLGLLSLGINWTIIGATTQIPDHGYWGNGTNRLYVHRGTGHYGYPLRVGVPGEESLLRVWFSADERMQG